MNLNLKFSRDKNSAGLSDVVFTQFCWLNLCFHINIDWNLFYQKKMLVTIESMKQLIYNNLIFLKICTYNNIGFNTQPNS